MDQHLKKDWSMGSFFEQWCAPTLQFFARIFYLYIYMYIYEYRPALLHFPSSYSEYTLGTFFKCSDHAASESSSLLCF